MNRPKFIIAISAVLFVAFALGWFSHWLLRRFTRFKADLGEFEKMAQELHEAEETRDQAITYLQQQGRIDKSANQTMRNCVRNGWLREHDAETARLYRKNFSTQRVIYQRDRASSSSVVNNVVRRSRFPFSKWHVIQIIHQNSPLKCIISVRRCCCKHHDHFPWFQGTIPMDHQNFTRENVSQFWRP